MKHKTMMALGLLGSACLTTNVYAESIDNIIYGENIPADHEKEYMFVGEEKIIDAYKDISKEEANAIKISLESSGYTTVILKSYTVKTGEITQSIEKQFTNFDVALDYVTYLKEQGIIVENVEFIYDAETKNDSLNETFDTLDEAQNALDKFKNEYNENFEGSIEESKTDNVIESIEGTTSYETYEAAKEALDTFIKENETNEFYFTGTVVGPKGTGEYTESKIEETFNSEKEALEYLETLRQEGYTILDYKYTFNTETKNDSLNGTFDTLEEAQNALDKFKNEYNENFEGSIEESKTDNVIESIEGTTSYETYEAAKEALDTFIKENETNEFYFTGTVVGPKGTGEYTESKIEETFNSEKEALEYLETLRQEGYAITEYEFTKDIIEEDRVLNETFDTEEAAQDALEKFINKYNATGSLVAIYNSEKDIDRETIEGTTGYNTEEEAQAALQNAINSVDANANYYIKGTVTGPTLTSSIILTQAFDTEEEALDFIEQLEADGYIIEDYSFVNNTETQKVELNETFKTEEAAQNALDDFEKQYGEDTGTIIKEYNETKNTIDSTYTTEEYRTEEEAQAALEEEISKTDDTYLITGTISNTTTTSSIEAKTFDTEEEAQAYINSIKAQGYDISKIIKEILHYQDGYWVTELGVKIEQSSMNSEAFSYGHFDVTLQTSFTKIDLDGNKTTVTGTITIDKVEIDGQEIEMSGPSTDQNTGLNEYTSVERFSLNITNSTYAKIEGYITLSDGKKLPFTLEGYLNEDNNVCGGGQISNRPNRPGMGNTKGFDIEFGEIKIIEQKVYIESNLTQKYYVHGDKSLTLYKGELTKYNKHYDYIVEATGSKTVTLDSGIMTANKNKYEYFINTTKVNKGYDYVVEATGKETIILESGTLTGNKEKENQGYYYNVDKKDKKHIVTAKGSKTITLESGTLKADTKEDVLEELYALDLIKQKYKYVGGIGGSEEENPQTGDPSLWVFTFGGFSMIGLAATASYLKKEEDEETSL